MPLTHPQAAPSALRRIPLEPADTGQQAGMTASGRRPSSDWAARASFDAEYQQWRGERRPVPPMPGQARDDDCRSACQSCTRASRGLDCLGGGAVAPPVA